MASNVARAARGSQFSAISGLTQMSSSKARWARPTSSSARSARPRCRFRRPGRAGGDECRRWPGSFPAKSAEPAEPIAENQSGRRADRDHRAGVGDTLPLTDDRGLRRERSSTQSFSQVSGVGSVTIFGPQRPSIRIQVDPARIAAAGLDPRNRSVRADRASASANAPKGSDRRARATAMTVYDDDQIFKRRCHDWDNVVIAYRNGAPIRIRDIGQAVNGPENTHVSPRSPMPACRRRRRLKRFDQNRRRW